MFNYSYYGLIGVYVCLCSLVFVRALTLCFLTAKSTIIYKKMLHYWVLRQAKQAIRFIQFERILNAKTLLVLTSLRMVESILAPQNIRTIIGYKHYASIFIRTSTTWISAIPLWIISYMMIFKGTHHRAAHFRRWQFMRLICVNCMLFWNALKRKLFCISHSRREYAMQPKWNSTKSIDHHF